MQRNSAVCFLIAAVVAVGAGCDSVSGLDHVDSTESSSTTSAAPSVITTQTSLAPTSSAPASGPKHSALPLCSSTEAGTPPPDCSFEADDSTGLTFEVRRNGITAYGAFSIDILTSNGTVAQTITEQVRQINSAPPPSLTDTDADGRDELLIPLAVGPDWTEYALYRATLDATEFTRAGEFTGLAIEPTADGYTVVSAKLSDNRGWKYTFWTYESDELVPVLTAELAFTSENGQKTSKECTIVSAPGLTYTAFSTLAEARTHFCAQPPISS